jgi:hypothetical protein
VHVRVSEVPFELPRLTGVNLTFSTVFEILSLSPQFRDGNENDSQLEINWS